MTKPQCLAAQVTSTCTPTHSGVCAALSTSGDCDAHASCTWSDSGTAEDAEDDTCMDMCAADFAAADTTGPEVREPQAGHTYTHDRSTTD